MFQNVQHDVRKCILLTFTLAFGTSFCQRKAGSKNVCQHQGIKTEYQG